jgi:hypothetical protein
MNRRSTIATNSLETTKTTTHRIYTDFDDDDDDDDDTTSSSSSHDNHIDGNDVYMSHRIQRFIQTALSPLDIDDIYDDDDDNDDFDEIHITSTGQTIQLQDLFIRKTYHKYKKEKNSIIHQPPSSSSSSSSQSPPHRHVNSVSKASYSARKYSDFFTWKIDSSVVKTKCSGCGSIDHQIWLFCGIATFTITVLFLVSLYFYYYNHQRFIQKCVPPSKHASSSSSLSSSSSSSSSFSITKTTTAVNINTNTTTIPLSNTVIVESSKLIQNQINEPDKNMVHDIGTTIRNDTAVPPLIQELYVDNKINPNNDVIIETLFVDDLPKTSSDTMLHLQHQMISTLPTTSLIPTDTTTPDDDHDAVDHVVTLVSALQEKCQLQNIEYDNQVIWQWAIQQQTTKQQIKTQEMIQIRQCMIIHNKH